MSRCCFNLKQPENTHHTLGIRNPAQLGMDETLQIRVEKPPANWWMSKDRGNATVSQTDRARVRADVGRRAPFASKKRCGEGTFHGLAFGFPGFKLTGLGKTMPTRVPKTGHGGNPPVLALALWPDPGIPQPKPAAPCERPSES